jgi:hypothetical protein
VLHAPYADKSLVRNALAYKLYADMGHYSVRFRFVELVIDRQYQGVYMLVEKIKRDKHRVDIAKLGAKDVKGADLTGGYIFRIDRVNGKGGSGWHSSFNSQAKQIYFQYEYPDPDSLQQAQKDYLKAYVDSFETALMGASSYDPQKGYRKYIETGSFVDNLILNELSRNTDGYRLSTFFYKDRINKGGRISCGPVWDYDLAWGNNDANLGSEPVGWQFDMLNEDFEIPFWWSRLMKDTMFANDLYCHYTSYRKTCLDPENICRYVDSLAASLDEAQKRNFRQWPLLGTRVFYEPWPILKTYQEEVGLVKTWVRNRIAWMDTAVKGACARPLVEENAKFKVHWNPMITKLSIDYHLVAAEEVNVEIFAVSGSRVKSFSLGKRKEGRHTDLLDMENLASGTYLLKVSLGNKVYKEKKIKI